ncbi:hypothetical protein RHGRI_010474 [Rhododendron griersonianum]|uniref:Uncharacterized protein n=1 Tax=Rhododendron griersonianum TaxID=479676 RepID=A0AAV6KJ96_9ERIC|nr:hypothetical protein RHGRI_010474 [Rhododendron griersonianum]
MAHLGTSAIQILVAVTMALLCASVVAAAAQDGSIAPMPALETGVGFKLPVSGTLICSSVLFSLAALLLH